MHPFDDTVVHGSSGKCMDHTELTACVQASPEIYRGLSVTSDAGKYDAQRSRKLGSTLYDFLAPYAESLEAVFAAAHPPGTWKYAPRFRAVLARTAPPIWSFWGRGIVSVPWQQASALRWHMHVCLWFQYSHRGCMLHHMWDEGVCAHMYTHACERYAHSVSCSRKRA